MTIPYNDGIMTFTIPRLNLIARLEKKNPQLKFSNVDQLAKCCKWHNPWKSSMNHINRPYSKAAQYIKPHWDF